MKQKEIDDYSPSFISSDSADYDYNCNESPNSEDSYDDKDEYLKSMVSHNISENEKINNYEIASKISQLNMKNNCVNLQCMDNYQTLQYMKEKYEKLEQNYFNLENLRTQKNEELSQTLRMKEEEKKQLESICDVYENQRLDNMDYFKLKGLEAKILKSLEMIKERKYKLLIESNTKNLDKRICVICYEKEIEILIKPCNHLSVCSLCSGSLKLCPICRVKIILKEPVKFS